ncbi:outer membrane beta-barrel protein [Rhodoblastus acidophilus]|uniref:Outer membrane beta-barrel protein n=1 Tax=Rhodoblastus acidophilus TaxID=1074 RepID=A0A6N8DSC1_RHOAC|nr:outer membrane beta-barrel protein [Rhodoblastus acidophilus]MCW2275596.1 opacity protein-like surface antigen [Rhodoblastus acidophilus]MTV32093.1 outer membrane beta-barrel protein [Rhodoblastus acidophilus]
MRKVTKAAAAAMVLLAGGAMRAQAADMLPPAYQLESDAMVEFGSGWYLRGDIGYSTQSVPGFAYSTTNPVDLVSTPPSALLTNAGRNVGLMNSTLGVGYAFNRWFRSDVTYEWNQTYAGTYSQTFVPYYNGSYDVGGCPFSATTLTSCYKVDKAGLQNWSLMANVYGDFGTWFGVTPYVGGGIGFTNLRATSAEQFYFSNGTTYSYNGTNNTWCPSGSGSTCYIVGYAGPKAHAQVYTNFSWSLMAGMAYDIAPHLKLDIGYRYMNMGSISVVDASQNTVRKTIDAQQVRAGLRWTPDL